MTSQPDATPSTTCTDCGRTYAVLLVSWLRLHGRLIVWRQCAECLGKEIRAAS